MSKDRHSYVAFYPSDWIAGTARMTPMQEIVYFRICLFNWDKADPCPGGELPLMLGAVQDWQSIVADLIAAGKLVGSLDGTVENPRAVSEARNAKDLWERKSKGGKKGAAKTNKSESGGDNGGSTPAKSPAKTAANSPAMSDGETGPGVPSHNQNQNQNQIYSEANASGAVAPPSVTRETKQPELVPASKPAEPVTEPDIPLCLVRIDNGDYAKALFRNGLAFVAEQLGKPPADCRALMGRWLKACGDDHKRLFGILADAQRDGRADLRSWVPKAIEAKSGAAGAVADDALSPTVRDIIARQKAERAAG